MRYRAGHVLAVHTCQAVNAGGIDPLSDLRLFPATGAAQDERHRQQTQSKEMTQGMWSITIQLIWLRFHDSITPHNGNSR